jgi:hypothetical protein
MLALEKALLHCLSYWWIENNSFLSIWRHKSWKKNIWKPYSQYFYLHKLHFVCSFRPSVMCMRKNLFNCWNDLKWFFLFSLFVYPEGIKSRRIRYVYIRMSFTMYACICLSISFSFSFSFVRPRVRTILSAQFMNSAWGADFYYPFSLFFSYALSLSFYHFSFFFFLHWIGYNDIHHVALDNSRTWILLLFLLLFSFSTHMCMYCLQGLFAFIYVASIAHCNKKLFFHQNKFDYIISIHSRFVVFLPY